MSSTICIYMPTSAVLGNMTVKQVQSVTLYTGLCRFTLHANLALLREKSPTSCVTCHVDNFFPDQTFFSEIGGQWQTQCHGLNAVNVRSGEFFFQGCSARAKKTRGSVV